MTSSPIQNPNPNPSTYDDLAELNDQLAEIINQHQIIYWSVCSCGAHLDAASTPYAFQEHLMIHLSAFVAYRLCHSFNSGLRARCPSPPPSWAHRMIGQAS